MKTNLILTLLFFCLFFSACGLVKQNSMFNQGTLSPGMTKNSFISDYGHPFSYNFYFDESGILMEELFYKESMFVEGEWHVMNSMFFFENGILVRQEQREDWVHKYEQFMEEQRGEFENNGN